MNRTEVAVFRRYLALPIRPGLPPVNVMLYLGEKPVAELNVCLDYVCPTDTVFLDVGAYRGQTLTVAVDADYSYLSRQTDTLPARSEYPYRPRLHFTPPAGWSNDPNGLFCSAAPDGSPRWHLFYQCNPFGRSWNNMHWGSAVSGDLLHWTPGPLALCPDETGTMFSGCAVVDRENRSGLKRGSADPILLFYTAAGGTNRMSAGRPFTQCLAVSTDGGATFCKYPGNPIVPNQSEGNRDPKVIWCAELNRYVMALYLCGSTYALLVSDDLLHWYAWQQVELTGDGECPDFFPLTVHGQRKWILMGALGRYVVGEIQGGAYRVLQPVRPLLYERFGYAGQTFFNAPGGARIGLLWDRGLSFADAPFNGQMSIPYRLTLEHRSGEYRLCAQPVDALRKAAARTNTCTTFAVTARTPWALPIDHARALDLELLLDDAPGGDLRLSVFGIEVDVLRTQNLVKCGKYQCPLALPGAPAQVRLVIDAFSVEAFCGNGESLLTCPVCCNYNCRCLRLESNGDAAVHRLTIREFD